MTRNPDSSPLGLGWAWLSAGLCGTSTILLLLLDAFGLSLFHGAFDTGKAGTYSDWFQGVITLVAIVVALLAIRNDRRLAEEALVEARRTREEVEAQERKKSIDEQRGRASQVFAWIEPRRDPVTALALPPVAIVANMTGVPVFEWNLRNASGDEVANSCSGGALLIPGRTEVVMKPQLATELHEQSSVAEIEFVSYMGERVRRVGVHWELSK